MYKQIKQVRLDYDSDVMVTLPKKLNLLGVITQPSPHGTLNNPYLVYLHEDGAETELKTLRLISGQAEISFQKEQMKYLGIISPKKGTITNFCTLWEVRQYDNTPKKDKKVAAAV